jgi:hypothetical protein
MNLPHRNTGCRVIPITSGRRFTAAPAPLAPWFRQSLDLSELTAAIRSDRELACLVTEAACIEFGWKWLSLEDAIVLLGADRLSAIATNLPAYGRTSAQLRRISQSFYPWENAE